MPSHANVRWRLLLDTAEETGFVKNGVLREGGGQHRLTARSLALFQQEAGTADEARDVRGRRTGETRAPFVPPGPSPRDGEIREPMPLRPTAPPKNAAAGPAASTPPGFRIPS